MSIFIFTKRTIYIFLCILFSLIGCRKNYPCPEVIRYPHNLSEAQKNLLPYHLGDTIRFISSLGDTMVSIVVGDSLFYQDKVADSGSPDCPHNISQYQVKSYGITAIKGNLNFTVGIYNNLQANIDYIPNGGDFSNMLKTSVFSSDYFNRILYLDNANSPGFLVQRTFFNNSTFNNVTQVLRKWGEIYGDTIFLTTGYGLTGATIGGVSYVVLK